MYNYSDNYIDPNFYQSILGNNPDTKNRLCAGLTYEDCNKIKHVTEKWNKQSFPFIKFEIATFLSFVKFLYEIIHICTAVVDESEM